MADVLWLLSHIQWIDVLDISLVATIFYLLLSVVQGTQAVQLLRGAVVVILIAFLVSQLLPLEGFRWLISTGLSASLVAIPVIFQPELRRALERIGRTGSLLVRRRRQEEVQKVIDQVAITAQLLSGKRHGALHCF